MREIKKTGYFIFALIGFLSLNQASSYGQEIQSNKNKSFKEISLKPNSRDNAPTREANLNGKIIRHKNLQGVTHNKHIVKNKKAIKPNKKAIRKNFANRKFKIKRNKLNRR